MVLTMGVVTGDQLLIKGPFTIGPPVTAPATLRLMAFRRYPAPVDAGSARD
jgi:hypothetical protein